jgi:dienelactone hydrolase
MDAIKVSDEGLVANLYLPTSPGKHPLVIVLSGSDGGLISASWYGEPLAALGYATLALAYFAMDGLPPDLVEIPLEYFKKAIDWGRAHPSVDGNRVALLGHSRGGEAALLVAAAYPDVRLVVANVPSHVAWGGIHPVPGTKVPAWTRSGAGVPFMSLGRPPRDGEILRDVFEEALRDASPDQIDAAAIPVERINGPILFVTGRDDRVWPSTMMADCAAERLRRHAFKFAVEHAAYDDAGHAILIPAFRFGQVSNAWPDASYRAPAWRSGQAPPQLGGTPDGNRHARMHAWSNMVAFLRRNLR